MVRSSSSRYCCIFSMLKFLFQCLLHSFHLLVFLLILNNSSSSKFKVCSYFIYFLERSINLFEEFLFIFLSLMHFLALDLSCQYSSTCYLKVQLYLSLASILCISCISIMFIPRSLRFLLMLLFDINSRHLGFQFQSHFSFCSAVLEGHTSVLFRGVSSIVITKYSVTR